jgi:hypothetical protein
MRIQIFICYIGLLLAAEDSYGIQLSSFNDISMKSGLVFGTAKKIENSVDIVTQKEFQFTNFSIGGALNQDLIGPFFGYGHAQLALGGDPFLFREAYGGAIGYHIWGEDFKKIVHTKMLKSIKTSYFNVSGLLKLEVQRYHLPAPEDEPLGVELAVIHTALGIEGRYTFDYGTVGGEAYTQLFNSPVGTNIYEMSSSEVSIFYRMFF